MKFYQALYTFTAKPGYAYPAYIKGNSSGGTTYTFDKQEAINWVDEILAELRGKGERWEPVRLLPKERRHRTHCFRNSETGTQIFVEISECGRGIPR